MLVRVKGKSVEGVVEAPPSKSFTHRALICASLAEGESKVINPSPCDDSFATIKALKALGIELSLMNSYVIISGGNLSPKVGVIDCEESGTTLRLITGVSSLINHRIILTGGKSLLRRPIGELVSALNKLGAKVMCRGDYPPVVSYGGFKGGVTDIRGDISSQFISSLLLISPLGGLETTLSTYNAESKPYIFMTLEVQKAFGVNVKVNDDGNYLTFRIPNSSYRGTNYLVEGDWSSASYFLVAAAISGHVKVTNLNLSSLQADKEVLKVVKEFGASVMSNDNSVEVIGSRLEGFEYDVSDSPDLLPTLAVLAASAKGRSVIRGVGRCRLKESDRVESTVANLKALGVDVRVVDDGITIVGVDKVKSGIVNSYGDHRIAMAFSTLSLISDGGIVIEDPLCVSKSFPNFWNNLSNLGLDVEVIL
ncbi:MAG: 3-phosphoshikimate 1-carboxyvinyltransferase [Sulfolobales archaeon]|nr:3-phosphoshikimate 1-carboxyvinyltransferase [Sulfolobales archaeon]MCX8186000.1 3-phosphoshikimate 1-carboxyvinyltransferase [Sulfolobales archaeon]MDW7969257.1 3-phosphoshikimate 1-carboxyvinyltransferase [Sulfolobales archaeon]